MITQRKILFLICSLLSVVLAQAQQIRGVVTDAETGDSIPMVSVIYKGHHVAVVSDVSGRFTIDRHEGWNITFSAVGYKSRIVAVTSKTKGRLHIKLSPDKHMLAEVTVKAKRQKYSRKNNPAVELMRRVVAAKKKTDLSLNDYYQYNKYEKITLSLNDLKSEQLETGPFKKHPWLVEQVEVSPQTGKMILPVSVDETVSQKIYRRDPRSEKTIVMGQTSKGVNHLFQTGDIINTVLKDVFTDIDLYQDHIRLLQYPFISPISNEGIGFYRYYIEDTLAIERDSCIHLHFLPNNQQDMGFRGDLYVLKDSSLHVRRCEMTIPKQSNVNFVNNVKILQEYTKLPNGQWVLSKDDMTTDLNFASFLRSTTVTRTTCLTDYSFDPLPKKLFKGKAKQVTEADAQMRDDEFWKQYRQVELTKSEGSMDKFVHRIENIKGMKYVIFGLKALFENSIETSTPNYIDICPVNTILSNNYVDGWRSRLSFKTTANLNKHFFLSAYYGRGWGSHKNYYLAEMTYSLNPKKYLPHEYPRRTLTVQLNRDVCSPSDRFMDTDKDNFMVALKWAKVDKMMLYNRQQVTFDYETDWGLKATLIGKREENESCGKMTFTTLDQPAPTEFRRTGNGDFLKTTEVTARLRYAPGETYINNKLRRRVINMDAPVFSISHTMGFDGIMGGQYNYNFTEAHIYKRFWLSSWGKLDFSLKAGIQWSQVPYPLLIHPAANQSYIIAPETFNLINTMEFLNDRYASFMMSWDLNGKIFNRIPLIKKLHWREYFGVRMLWGSLSDKNNPLLEQNRGNGRLMYFPEGCHVMDPHRPYAELVIGIHNVFKIWHIEYVRRLSYTDLPNSPKWGMRYVIALTF
ncbi:MAG: carboxypeptidase-like regulatory domain-containing protein [Prevotella sp.]|nr:carboxypeptidase-like regulatory domain-containing protein [Prevotella sp.]